MAYHSNTFNGGSYCGCHNPTYICYVNSDLMIIITNANRVALLPPSEDIVANGHPVSTMKHVYSVEGTGHLSPELVFRNLSSPLSLLRNQELRIWHSQDWVIVEKSGAVCVDVYAWYIQSITPVERYKD